MISREAPLGLLNSVAAWCPEVYGIKGAIVAGGFIRAYYAGEKPADLDLYFKSKIQNGVACEVLKEAGWEQVFKTDRATSFNKDGKVVQAISYLYGDAGEILQGFDFTICSAALHNLENTKDENVKGNVCFHDDFFEHLAGRVLEFNGSPLPLASFKRVIKYVKKGYSMCDENIIKLSECIADTVNFKDEQSVTDHMAGMDPDGSRRIRVVD